MLDCGREGISGATQMISQDSTVTCLLDQNKTAGVAELLLGLVPDALNLAQPESDWPTRLANQNNRLMRITKRSRKLLFSRNASLGTRCHHFRSSGTTYSLYVSSSAAVVAAVPIETIAAGSSARIRSTAATGTKSY